MAEVKALACELPAKLGLPLSRFSWAELRRHVLSLQRKALTPDHFDSREAIEARILSFQRH